jgi:biliverdin reductase / flavin reductase
MKLLIFGASGQTGQELVSQALERGHSVTAVARNVAAIAQRHERLRTVRADVMDPSTLDPVIRGHDAALSSLGPNKLFFSPTTVYSVGSVNVVRAMERQSVKRLIAVTSAGVEDHDPGYVLFYRLVLKPMLQRVYDDAKVFEAELAKSQLDWTVVRPGRISGGPRTGRYSVSARFLPKGKSFAITRADLAAFMLGEIESPKWIRGTPTLRG